MTKIKKTLRQLSALIERAKNKRLTAEDIAIIALAVIAFITLVVLLATIKHWGMPLLAIAFLAYMAYDEFRSRRVAPPHFPLEFVVYSLLQRIVNENHKQLFAVKHANWKDLVVLPSIILKNGITMVRAKIKKAMTAELSNEELNLVASLLQSEIERYLIQGEVPFIPYISFDGRAPAIFVDSVFDNVVDLIVDVVFIDTPEKLNYFYRRYHLNIHQRPQDFDGEF